MKKQVMGCVVRGWDGKCFCGTLILAWGALVCFYSS